MIGFLIGIIVGGAVIAWMANYLFKHLFGSWLGW